MDLFATPATIALAILALGVLIIVHEGGHFLVARLSGMRVDRFSIGFGPKLFSFKRGETEYQIAAIPLGGFVQIAGLNPGEEGMTQDDPRAYPNRPVWQRLATIFAGPGTNYVFAACMLLIMFLAWGVPGPGKSPVVDDVIEGKPAVAAGFEPDDEVIAVNGTKVKEVQDVAPLVNASQGNPIAIDILRAGKPMVLKVKPEKDGSDYRIGVQLGVTTNWEQVSTGQRVARALTYPFEYSKFVLQTLAQGGVKNIVKHGSGPIGIVKEMRKRIEHGPRHAFMIIALISIYLGLFNLLPLPGLDGGRLVFLGWEAVSRRKVNQRIEQTVHMVGVLLLLGLILVISFKNDLHIGSWFKH
ncbi:MAG: rane-associated zinc metalloprotease [Myxococcales bacterium]|nr:rane-associated zinc metalloprotease [Myxococcales bacterium]